MPTSQLQLVRYNQSMFYADIASPERGRTTKRGNVLDFTLGSTQSSNLSDLLVVNAYLLADIPYVMISIAGREIYNGPLDGSNISYERVGGNPYF